MNTTYIDDTDPTLKYSPPGAWITSGGSQEYNRSTHYTTLAGATVTLVFNGTGVGVYGTVASVENSQSGGPPMSLFSVDDVDRTQYSAVPSPGEPLYRQRFYTSPPLQNTQHTLVVTKFHNSSGFFLDYFVVYSPTPSPSTTSSTSFSTVVSSLSHHEIGTIVGGVLGGFVLLVVLVGVLLSRRPSRRNAPKSVDVMSRQEFTNVPVLVSGIYTSQSDTESPYGGTVSTEDIIHTQANSASTLFPNRAAETMSSFSAMYTTGDSTSVPSTIPWHPSQTALPLEIIASHPHRVVDPRRDSPPGYST